MEGASPGSPPVVVPAVAHHRHHDSFTWIPSSRCQRAGPTSVFGFLVRSYALFGLREATAADNTATAVVMETATPALPSGPAIDPRGVCMCVCVVSAIQVYRLVDFRVKKAVLLRRK